MPRALALLVALAVPRLAAAQDASDDAARGIALARRLARTERLGAAVPALLARLDREAERTSAGPGSTAAVHEALVVLTAHDPMPARALEADEVWSPRSERQALARAWHALLDPVAGRPLGELRRAGLAAGRDAFYDSDPAVQFSIIRRLARSRQDRRWLRLAILALWDLGASSDGLTRAAAFGRRHGLSPATPAEIREHCRVHCCS